MYIYDIILLGFDVLHMDPPLNKNRPSCIVYGYGVEIYVGT